MRLDLTRPLIPKKALVPPMLLWARAVAWVPLLTTQLLLIALRLLPVLTLPTWQVPSFPVNRLVIPHRLADPLFRLETTSGAWVLLTRTELILLMTVKRRFCRIPLLPRIITPLCRQLKFSLPPALQATLVLQVVWCLLPDRLRITRFMASFRQWHIPFTYLSLWWVRQLPMAMTRIFPLVSVPRQVGRAVIRAPFLLACTLVTCFRRRTTLLTIRIGKRPTFSMC